MTSAIEIYDRLTSVIRSALEHLAEGLEAMDRAE
jgi:hypothetical protein